MKYKNNLRVARLAHEKTEKEIARILGIKYQQYQRYEQGKYQMPVEMYKTLARYYKGGFSVDYLCAVIFDPDGKLVGFPTPAQKQRDLDRIYSKVPQ